MDTVMDRDMGMISMAIQLHWVRERPRKLEVYKRENMTIINIGPKKN